MEETQDRTDIRDSNGRFLAPPPGSEKTRITTDNARLMVQKRVEKYRRQAVKKIVEEAKSIDPSVSVGADAFGLVAAKQFSALMDSEKPRISDLEKLGQIMTGASAMDNSQRENVPPGALIAAPSTLMELVARIEAERAAAVDRARAVDATTVPDAD